MTDRVPLPPCVLDYRDRHAASKRGRRRQWDSITGITLHQTACLFLRDNEELPQRIERARERVATIGVHAVVLRNGDVVLSNPLDHQMPQAQRYLNRRDVGIEIDGYYAGIVGDDATFWRPKSAPNRKPLDISPRQVASALAFCRWAIAEVAAHGGRVEYVHAHRQTSTTRRSDPGEALWRAVGLPLQLVDGLSDGGDGWYVPERSRRVGDLWTTNGPGRPIPHEWDERRTVRY